MQPQDVLFRLRSLLVASRNTEKLAATIKEVALQKESGVVLPSSSMMRSFISAANISRQPKAAITGFIHKLSDILDRFVATRITKKNAAHTPPLKSERKFAIIGIHGWGVSQKILQNIIGVPSSSDLYIKFMVTAIKNITHDPFSVVEIPLNGHGCIMERVHRFLPILREKLADKHITDIIVVAHSQGVPVAIILIDILLKEGVFSKQRTSIMAMAGIFHGPFPHLGKNLFVQYMETESSRELFELHAPCSNASSGNTLLASRLRAALASLLTSEIRLVAIGSWMDQLVPLYSSTLYGFYHPNILRLVFIDEKMVEEGADSFLPQLVSLCLALKNIGYEDHGLLVYLSEWIAGSLVGGDNLHSSIYSEPLVYQTVASLLLEDCKATAGSSPKYVPFEVPEIPNHYHIPWMMHALISDGRLRSIPVIKEQLDILVSSYLDWNPASKLLKELKRKLAPLATFRAML